MSDPRNDAEPQGQLNVREAELLSNAITNAKTKPGVVLEVGTWLGGGSTLHILRALESNNAGHLWGIEADRSIYEQMIANIRRAAPTASTRFTPLFGRSQQVIPKWLKEKGAELKIDAIFLDGGNNPMEQVTEFCLLDPYIPVGGTLMTHDAKLRKGKWLVPYLSALDNWQCALHDVSDEGFFIAEKTAMQPSARSFRAARVQLRRLRLQPAELVAAFLPSKVCSFVLRLLPAARRRQLAEGRQ